MVSNIENIIGSYLSVVLRKQIYRRRAINNCNFYSKNIFEIFNLLKFLACNGRGYPDITMKDSIYSAHFTTQQLTKFHKFYLSLVFKILIIITVRLRILGVVLQLFITKISVWIDCITLKWRGRLKMRCTFHSVSNDFRKRCNAPKID